METSLSLLAEDVPYEAARTHLEWGRIAYEQGHLQEARQHVQQALTTFTDLEAKRDIARAEELSARIDAE
jgi:flagellin-specific chaperone FliS